jgi:RHS repeat-associated protein
VRYYRYDAYGQTTAYNASGGAVTLGTALIPQSGVSYVPERLYTGQRWDWQAQVYYYGARMYDPRVANFLTEDPVITYANPYAYVRWNPVRYVDPTGAELTQGGLATLTAFGLVAIGLGGAYAFAAGGQPGLAVASIGGVFGAVSAWAGGASAAGIATAFGVSAVASLAGGGLTEALSGGEGGLVGGAAHVLGNGVAGVIGGGFGTFLSEIETGHTGDASAIAASALAFGVLGTTGALAGFGILIEEGLLLSASNIAVATETGAGVFGLSFAVQGGSFVTQQPVGAAGAVGGAFAGGFGGLDIGALGSYSGFDFTSLLGGSVGGGIGVGEGSAGGTAGGGVEREGFGGNGMLQFYIEESLNL